jgi:hypothetical protein
MKALATIFLLMLLVSCSSTQERDLSRFASEAADGMALPEYTSKDIDNKELQAKAAFVYTLLFNTVELNVHRMNGETDNQVFVHESGGEAVYDKDGNLVKNCENMGSFNYAHHKREPLLHFSVDTLPWLRWGNCREDTTTSKQRVNAYIKDIEDALEASITSDVGYFLPEGFMFENSAQNQAIAFFLSALNYSNFDVYEFVLTGLANRRDRKKFLEALESGFIANLKKPNKRVN